MKSVLTIEELVKIEKTEVLVKTAQTVQLLQDKVVKNNIHILNNGPSKTAQTIPFNKKLENLGFTEKEYNRCAEELHKDDNWQTKHIIDNLAPNLVTKTDLEKKNLQGVLLICGFRDWKDNQSPHAIFLQLDNENKNYILYDNSRGFYR